MYICAPSASSVHGSPKRVLTGSRGTGVTDGWELPCECWGLKPSPLEEE